MSLWLFADMTVTATAHQLRGSEPMDSVISDCVSQSGHFLSDWEEINFFLVSILS